MTTPSPDTIALYLPESRNGRRFALVSKVLSAMKRHHVAVVPLLKRIKLGKLEKSALASDYCKTVARLPENASVVIAEKGQLSASQRRKTKKVIWLSFDTQKYLASPSDGHTLFHPMLFHPNMIELEAYEHARQLSSDRNRPIRLLFAGNCDRGTYDNKNLSQTYNLLNRYQIHECVKRLPGELVAFPGTKEEFNREVERGAYSNRLVWINTQDFRFPQQDWLQLLSKAQYFICTPGAHYPYCQNLNEAMACGAVPLLQYPHLYHPRLKNGENCVAFTDEQSLHQTVSSLLTEATGKDWAGQSQSAISYHESHLGLKTLSEKLSAFFASSDETELTWVLAGKV